jgi:hypothetical protein
MIDEATLSAQLHAIDVSVPRDLAQRAIAQGHRRNRLRRGGAVLGAVGIVVAVVVTVPLTRSGSAPARVFAAGVVPTATGSTTCAIGHLYGPAGISDDPKLEAVCLPHPAPGFPYLRGGTPATTPQFGGYDHGELVRVFLVGATPDIVTRSNGGQSATSKGAEATIEVARSGSFPTKPEAVRAARVDTVLGTTTVRGVTATVVKGPDAETGVLVQIGGFDIRAYGSDAAGPAPTVKQLTVLIGSLRNLG